MTVSATKIGGGCFILPGTLKGIWRRVASWSTDGSAVRIRSIAFAPKERVLNPDTPVKRLTLRRLFRPR